jgi:hypothetical protein
MAFQSGKNAHTPALFRKSGKQGFAGYGTWKTVKACENEQLIFATSAQSVVRKRER